LDEACPAVDAISRGGIHIIEVTITFGSELYVWHSEVGMLTRTIRP
jgi:hypothetical protein